MADKLSVFKAEPIETKKAVTFVKNYNEKYNSDLTNTSFIDFESDVLMKYFIDVKAKENTFNSIRIYFADYGENIPTAERLNKTSTIVVAVNEKGEYFKIPAYNYGGLCPPPNLYDQLKNNGDTLLVRAIDESQGTTLPLPPGRNVIKHYPETPKAPKPHK